MTDSLALEDIDLSSPELYATGDPHAVWTYLREHSPVFFQEHAFGPGYWAITRYDDVVALSSDKRLSSSGGRTTTGTPREPGSNAADILVVTDPPRHTQLRALVNKAFTPRVIASLEPFVQGLVDEIVDDLSARKACDFAAEVAARIPFTVICQLLGVPEEDRGALSHAVGHFMESRAHVYMPSRGGGSGPGGSGASPDEGAPSPDQRARNDLELAHYFLELANERGRAPRDDLVSRLVGAEVDGATLDDPDVLALATLLFIAGSETTMNAISGGLLAFIEHPSQRRRLAEEPTLWPRAVEEILRWVSPVLNGMVRTAMDDIDARGVRIPRGDKVTLWYPSANRDEDIFTDPFRFDVGREPNPHVGFGAGPHFCLGASLARLEIRVTLQTVLARWQNLELAGEVARLWSNVSNAIEHLPVRYRPAP